MATLLTFTSILPIETIEIKSDDGSVVRQRSEISTLTWKKSYKNWDVTRIIGRITWTKKKLTYASNTQRSYDNFIFVWIVLNIGYVLIAQR